MKSIKTNLTKEEQLLQARERGLQEASEVHSMKAHGKVLGMDTFSWINPQLDTLANVIESFPFSLHWVTEQKQAKSLLDVYPELAANIDSLIIFDDTILQVDRETLNDIRNVVCVEGFEEALTLLKTMKSEKSVFLMTSQRNSEANTNIFNAFVTENK